MAKPLRFRRSDERWTAGRVRSELYDALDANLGATMTSPWYKQPDGYEARRFEMDNGDVALFCWNDSVGYWLGNTETPRALWQTEKERFSKAPPVVADWAQTELLAQLYEEDPWLEDYPNVAWFFLPVFLSKDGRETSREFFRDHAAGFPDTDSDTALAFYDDLLRTDAVTDRHLMAGKLGTTEQIHLGRMSAAMSEFTVAKLLHEVGYDLTPEHEVSTGHSIDFRVDRPGEESVLVEVTRPLPTERRSASSAVQAITETVETKTSGQLREHGGGIVLFVDCSSFRDDDWDEIMAARPDVGFRPAVVFRVRPGADPEVEGYTKGSVPMSVPDGIED